MWGVFIVMRKRLRVSRRGFFYFKNWFGECSHCLGPLVPWPMFFFGEISVILYSYSQINQFPLTHWLIRLDILIFTLNPLNCETLCNLILVYLLKERYFWYYGIIGIIFWYYWYFGIFCPLQWRRLLLNWGRLVSSHLSPSSIAPPSTARRNNDDIYIIMQCLCVTKNHHFPLPSWAPEERSERPANVVMRLRRLWWL